MSAPVQARVQSPVQHYLVTTDEDTIVTLCGAGSYGTQNEAKCPACEAKRAEANLPDGDMG